MTQAVVDRLLLQRDVEDVRPRADVLLQRPGRDPAVLDLVLGIEDASCHMHVGAVLIFDAAPLRAPGGGIDIDRIRAAIHARLHLVPRFRQRLAQVPYERVPIWVDDDRFRLAYHVRHTALPRPGDERVLKRLVGRIMSQPLDRKRPVWEIWVVEGLDGDRFALISKTHHCMVDGISGADLMSVILDATPDARVGSPEPSQPSPHPSGARLVLYQPDIPQNAGALLRLAACLGVAVDIVEPCGFVFDDRRLRRAGMDYLGAVELVRHAGWESYGAIRHGSRLVLLTTRAATSYADFAFRADDRLLLGRESAGVPEEIHAAADARLKVPMRPGMRSLNVALAAAIVLGEALRQTGGLPAAAA